MFFRVFLCVFLSSFHAREKIPISKKRLFLCVKKSDLKNIRKKEGCPPNTRRKRNARDSETRAKHRGALENKPPLPLWRLFREALLSGGACRDIVEKHVMCKLNRDGS